MERKTIAREKQAVVRVPCAYGCARALACFVTKGGL